MPASAKIVPLPQYRGRRPHKGERWGGRQKGTPNKRGTEIAEIARQFTTEAMATVVTLMRNSEDEDIILRCADLIMNRGWGRAPQSVRLGGPQGEPLDLARLDDASLERLLIRLEQSVTGASASDDPARAGRASEATEVEATEVGFSQSSGGDQSAL
jgi:hypothetical protein